MGIVIKVPENMFKLVEKRLKYRFHDKERERSNHAQKFMESGITLPRYATRCLRNHDTMAWVGPPHDDIRAYVCLHCHAAACEPEIRDKGFTFEEIPDWEIHKIMDDDLKRQTGGNPRTFSLS